MNKQQLSNKIWKAANEMRSKIEANEYKDYILGFIFYKFLSEKEETLLEDKKIPKEKCIESESGVYTFVRNNIGYFIDYNYLFSTWLKKGSDFNVSDTVNGLKSFEQNINPDYKRVYEGIFNTLSSGLNKLGSSEPERTKAIRQLINIINEIPMNGQEDYDVLGYIYEDLISKFAANAGKKAGEFYTPHEASVLMSEIVASHLKNRKQIKVYDPTSGSGSLLINIGNSVQKYISEPDMVTYYAQEWKENTYNLTRMNLVMRNIKPEQIFVRNGDTLDKDWPFFDESDPDFTYDPLYVDAVVSNPPYSQKWDPTNKQYDKRFQNYGVAPKSKADYAFLLHDLYHLKPDGIMTIVLPHGVLFRGGDEGKIRQNLIENNNIDAVIGLPSNTFFGTGIPTIIMVLRQKRENTDVLIIDASKGFEKDGTKNKLRARDIRKIADAYINRESINKFSKVVSREEIRNNEYNLNIPRYVDSSESADSWDIYASMFGGIPETEIDELSGFWNAFPELKASLFKKTNTPYLELEGDKIKDIIKNHQNIIDFETNFNNAFEDFADYLKTELVAKMSDVVISKEEIVICNNIFDRLKNIPLIDRYEAYQLFDDEWNTISGDLEILQTEGFDAVKQVDPNMIIKKKGDKEQEIQDGWVGHILPFELVQSLMFKDELATIKANESRLSEIPTDIEEIFENLTEDEKQLCGVAVNEDDTTFDNKEITKKIKELKAEEQAEDVVLVLSKLEKTESLIKEEKGLKKQNKELETELHSKTKTAIESLTDDDASRLIQSKWTDTIVANLYKLPDAIVDNLVSKITAIQSKYQTTYFDVESQIKETEMKLASMIDDLCGSEYDLKGLSEFKSLLMGE